METYQPTLVRTHAALSAATGVGSTAELDFDFGYREGAKIMGVEYSILYTEGTTFQLYEGLYLGPTRANPTNGAQVIEDEDIVGFRFVNIFQEAVGEQKIESYWIDLSQMDIIITRNIRHVVFNGGATTFTGSARVYYNRVVMSADEAVFIMTIRR